MSQFDVGRRGRDQEAPLVPRGGPADEAASGDGGVDYRDVLREGGFEKGVKVFGSVNACKAIGVC
jgi:hypothetical protein